MKWSGLAALAVWAMVKVSGQHAEAQLAEELAMPTAADSNSPAFWREGRITWLTSQGIPWVSEASDFAGEWTTETVEILPEQNGGRWIESVWNDDDDTLFAWYHSEPHGMVEGSLLTAPNIGAAISVNGGLTFMDLGPVIDSGDPLDLAAQNGFFVGGNGDVSVILDRERKYFYFFFSNYGGPVENQGVGVARMAFEHRYDPAGNVWKYRNGKWDEPAVGGSVTPIFPVLKSWQASNPDAFWGPSIHWNIFLECYVILLNRAQGDPGWAQEGIYVSFCSDLANPESWTAPAKILDRSDLPGWNWFYPQVMGLEKGGTDTLAGQRARLYVFGISRWEIEFFAEASAKECPPELPSTPLEVLP